MTRVEEIEAAVASLSRDDFSRFTEWFYGFEDRLWEEKVLGG